MGSFEQAMTSHSFKYPNIRSELLDHLNSLSDRDYQNRVWVRHEPTPGIDYDDLNNVVHFLLDDMDLERDPDTAIGLFLLDRHEVAAISQVIEALNSLFEKYGLTLSDFEYLSKHEWQKVIDAAIAARNVLLANTPEYGST
jgi:hypothetical protein